MKTHVLLTATLVAACSSLLCLVADGFGGVPVDAHESALIFGGQCVTPDVTSTPECGATATCGGAAGCGANTSCLTCPTSNNPNMANGANVPIVTPTACAAGNQPGACPSGAGCACPNKVNAVPCGNFDRRSAGQALCNG
jgi:hypothetical protein